ncbi:hypothetical protein [Streptomyces sp. NPDC086787]|uniref:hypothetical protein n=1 Tax=Streptomyces sp. NPDC086787 TaxID=3365759 RepID=UPI00380EBB2D
MTAYGDGTAHSTDGTAYGEDGTVHGTDGTAFGEGTALSALPGVGGQLGEIAADLAAGLNCLWLLPDALTGDGQAEELYRAALHTAPDRLDVQPPVAPAVPAPRAPQRDAPAHRAGTPWNADEDWGDLPGLDFDDGFDIGWSDAAPVRTAPPVGREHAVPELFERLGKELGCGPGEVAGRLTSRSNRWRPVIGLRAWCEPDDQPPQAPPGGPGGATRGAGVERLFRSLTAAVKDAGLPPQERPRLLVVARLRDVPEALTGELDRGIETTAVHWWWGTLGRLDTAMVVAAARDRIPGRALSLEQRVLAAVREEVVTEVGAFDLGLARRLTAAWDGRADGLAPALRSCLDPELIARAADCPDTGVEAGTRRRPGSSLRRAWAQGVVQSWEGRLRRHPAAWCPAGPQNTPPELSVLVGQAQQRVVFPWIEDTREQLARLGARYATQPLDALVAAYLQRPPEHYRERPEEAFRQLEAGALLAAAYAGGVAFPREDLRLLQDLVTARNVLAHRGVLRDTTLRALCGELTRAHRRWSKL